MIVMLVSLLGIAVVAGGVLLYVAFPHQGRPLSPLSVAPRPVTRWVDDVGARMADAETRMVPADVSPASGLLCCPEADSRRRRRFEQAELALTAAIGACRGRSLPHRRLPHRRLLDRRLPDWRLGRTATGGTSAAPAVEPMAESVAESVVGPVSKPVSKPVSGSVSLPRPRSAARHAAAASGRGG